MKNFKFILIGIASALILMAGPSYASGGGGGGHGKAKEKTSDEPSTYGTKKMSSGAENFLQFYPTAATIFSGHSPAGLMHMEYGLDIKDQRIRERAAKLAPRLRDAYGRILSQYAGSLYTAGEVPDMQYLASRMQGVTDRIIGKGNARFLVSTLMVRDH
ncbi:MAG: hypothetical protein Q9M33_00430 [Robiginitomaculum sp.]|nr:hypothetical protein [Robiginitomaculum sp.]MDQ7078764.1 hypothetical protein [Robiginitomaculum sp.]